MSEEFLRQIRKMFLQAVREKWTRRQLERGLLRLFANNDTPAEFRAAILKRAMAGYDWMNSRTMSAEDLATSAKLLDLATRDFARAKGKIQNDVRRVVIKLIKSDASKSEIRDAVEGVIGRFRNYAETIARTSLGAFDRADQLRQAQEGGVQKFRYVGPAGERPFCRAHLGRVYTLEEIRRLRNGQQLPVEYYCGGWNCRHRWVPVEE